MTNQEIASTILHQLGGNKFIAMTGSKNFICGNRSLTMQLTRNLAGAKYLRITLNGNDLYNMEFIANKDLKVKVKHEDVYNDMLQVMFTKSTGLYTYL
jgi:hypothetical protein